VSSGAAADGASARAHVAVRTGDEERRLEALGWGSVSWGTAEIGAGSRYRARAWGIGDFSPDARARSQREVEADRWAATAHGVHQVVAHRERERERAGGAGS
jgi:hypothetical protein